MADAAAWPMPECNIISCTNNSNVKFNVIMTLVTYKGSEASGWAVV